MGNFCMKGRNYESEDSVTNAINSHILAKQQSEAMKVKLLLLGAGESGKTTLFKQMKISYTQESSKMNLSDEKDSIVGAFFKSFAELLKAIRKSQGTLGNPDLDEMMDHLYPSQGGRVGKQSFTPNVTQFVRDVWSSAEAKSVWENRSQFQVTDSLGYFLGHIDRMSAPGYIPTQEDYLRSRIQTTGIIEQSFKYREVTMVVLDVGGQRSERKKWIACFDGVNAVLFVAAISEFDQKLFEDTNVDRLTESVDLFHKTLAFRVFRDTPIMLFLNKHDLFLEKLEKIQRNGESLDKYFPELGLGTNYDDAEEKILTHLEGRFRSGALNSNRIFKHLTTALDNNKFRTVFHVMSQIILSTALDNHFESP